MPTSPDLTRATLRRWNRQARCYELMTAPMANVFSDWVIVASRGRSGARDSEV